LIIKDQNGQSYEIENLTWENLGEMGLNIGDHLLLSGTQLIDFRNYWTVFY
jgi:hypothetical protein